MPANTTPIFTNLPDIQWLPLNNGATVVSAALTGTGQTAYDGTTGSLLVFTAGANGSFVQKLVCEAGGTNAVSVLRIFVNNGTANTNASANSLYMQYSLPASTASNTVSTNHVEIPLALQLPATYRLYVNLGAAANLASGWYITTVAGDY